MSADRGRAAVVGVYDFMDLCVGDYLETMPTIDYWIYGIASYRWNALSRPYMGECAATTIHVGATHRQRLSVARSLAHNGWTSLREYPED